MMKSQGDDLCAHVYCYNVFAICNSKTDYGHLQQ